MSGEGLEVPQTKCPARLKRILRTLSFYSCHGVFFLTDHRLTVAFVYYGISLNIGDLGGNPYINFCISGGVELPANLLAIWLPQQKHVGRIWAFAGSYFSCAVVLFSIAAIPQCW